MTRNETGKTRGETRNKRLFDRAGTIRVSSDAGYCKIEFRTAPKSWFWRKGYDGLSKPWFRERVLVIQSAAFLFDLVKERDWRRHEATRVHRP